MPEDTDSETQSAVIYIYIYIYMCDIIFQTYSAWNNHRWTKEFNQKTARNGLRFIDWMVWPTSTINHYPWICCVTQPIVWPLICTENYRRPIQNLRPAVCISPGFSGINPTLIRWSVELLYNVDAELNAIRSNPSPTQGMWKSGYR